MTVDELRKELRKKEQRKQEKVDALILEIAKKHSIVIHERGDLEKRFEDDENFIKIRASELKKILRDVYKVGTKNVF